MQSSSVAEKIQPEPYSLSLTALDGIEDPPNYMSLATIFKQDMNATTLYIDQYLHRSRLWNGQFFALNCTENPVSNVFELSKSIVV